MSEVNRRYFESLMQAKQISLRALAKRMGMGHSQLSLTFSGARKLQLDEAAQLSQIFGEPLHRIVENAGVTVRPTSGKRVPVKGVVTGDGTVSVHPPGTVERANAPDGLPEEAIAIQCRTAGSPLDWADGWLMFCREPNGVDPAILGRFAYCKIKDGPTVVAAVRRGYVDESHNLSGLYHRENVALEFATPILLIRP